MKTAGALILAAVAICGVDAYPKFFNGMTWANYAWEIDPNEETVKEKDMVLVDAFDASADAIKQVGQKDPGAKITCYLSAGTWEEWRPDAGEFSKDLLMKNYYSGSSREKWFDITKWNELKPHMTRRLNMAKGKGCNAIEFDNQDCYVNGGNCMNGASYSELEKNQIDYANWLADEAHRIDLAVGLKNAMEIMSKLSHKYDFAINEECAQYGECGTYSAFTGQGKAVFGVEYNGESHCDEAEKEGISRKYKTSGGHWSDCPWMAEARTARMKKQEVDEESSSGPSAGLLIGGIVAGIACVGLIAGGGFYAYKKKAASYNMAESSTSIDA